MNAISQHRDDIQGLRALAVLAVIVFHVNDNWLPGGFIGVDIFFVISGYLITGILLRQKAQGGFSFPSFYASRLLRIVPVYFLVLAFATAAMAILFIPRDFDSFYESLKSAVLFNSNNYFSRQSDYFAPASHELPLLHTWSLAVEMQFYLLLPVLLVFVPVRFIKIVLGIIAGMLLLHSASLLLNGEERAVYFSLLARAPEFFVGSLLATISKDASISAHPNIKAWLGLMLVVLSFFLISKETAFPGFVALAPCIGVALLISAHGSKLNNWLSSRFIVLVGAISYSLYLWHWPILAGFRYYFEVYELPIGVLAAFAILTIALSSASYLLIEKPFRSNRGRKGFYKLAAFSSMAFLLVLMAKVANPIIASALPVEVSRYAAPGEICHGQIVDECLRGDPQSRIKILLLGDSHAAQLNNFADIVGQSQKLKMTVVTASSCVPIEGFDEARISEWARKPCRDQITFLKDRLSDFDALLVAGMWQTHMTSDSFLLALDDFLRATAERHQPVILLAQIPMLENNVQRMIRFEALGGTRVARLEKTWANANAQIEAMVLKYPNARFLDFSSISLFKKPPFWNDRIIYQDNHHLNEIGSKAYGQLASSQLGSVLKDLISSYSK